MDTATIATAVIVGAASLTAAVGVPQLLQRQRQDEALRELPRLVRSASTYFVKPRMDPKTGQRTACAFPNGEIRTTLAKSCCEPGAGGDGLCDPAKIEWNRTLWAALKWKINEPHAFIYAYEASGTLGKARFTASAYGDADCDGVYSTFRYTGTGGAASRMDDCIITEAAQFEAIQPDE